MADAFTIGIEEEFFLSDRHSGLIVPRMPEGFIEECHRLLPGGAAHEMLQSQIETTTSVCHEASELEHSVRSLRRDLAEIAGGHGLSLVASGTHPLAEWREQLHTEAPRYERMLQDFQIVGRRNLLCGLHVHVAPPEGVDRVDLMNRLMPWLPLLLGLSTSSPFWSRQDTGLASYRQAAYDEWPRTGIPDFFGGQADYDAFVHGMVQAQVIPDASQLWWSIRPSARYPTLELRICDSCTWIEDALCIASLFRCLVRAVVRLPELGRPRTSVTRMLIEENRWQAKRHGRQAVFVDDVSGSRRESLADALVRCLTIIEPDAEHFGCMAEVLHARRILARGTSADHQRAIYRRSRDAGQTRGQACRAVVRWLVDTTHQGGASLAFEDQFRNGTS